jgi:hypothetical protein
VLLALIAISFITIGSCNIINNKNAALAEALRTALANARAEFLNEIGYGTRAPATSDMYWAWHGKLSDEERLAEDRIRAEAHAKNLIRWRDDVRNGLIEIEQGDFMIFYRLLSREEISRYQSIGWNPQTRKVEFTLRARPAAVAAPAPVARPAVPATRPAARNGIDPALLAQAKAGIAECASWWQSISDRVDRMTSREFTDLILDNPESAKFFADLFRAEREPGRHVSDIEGAEEWFWMVRANNRQR